MRLPNFSRRPLIGAAVLACAAALMPATPGKVLYLNAMAAVPGTRRAIGAGVTYWGTNPVGAHQSAVILAYGS